MQANKAAVLGFVVGALAGAGGAVGVLRQTGSASAPVAGAERAATEGDYVPVVVAGQDLPEGTRLTFAMVEQRQVPAHLATRSIVKPESAQHVMNAALLVPVQKGDMLLWSQFATERTAAP